MAPSDTNPYKALKVSRSASQDEIKAAYRKLAKRLHPDVNDGDATVEQWFKEVTAAYDVLSDPKKRAKFDRETGGSPRAEPASASKGFWRSWTGRSTESDEVYDDIFEETFGGGGQTGAKKQRARSPFSDDLGSDDKSPGGAARGGKDVSYKLTVPFPEATAGGKRRVALSDGRSLNLNIPPGTVTGGTLRLKGQGREGPRGGKGDAFIEVTVAEHPYFSRDGQTINVEIPVTLDEAILGGSITVPTIHGNVALKIPKASNSGSVLRLKGKGVPANRGKSAGDQFVTLKIMLPDGEDRELIKFVDQWREGRGYNPRHKMGFL